MKLRLLAMTAAMLAAGTTAQAAGTLDIIKERGEVRCGVSQGVLGFSAPDKNGAWSGFDVDFCRAVAAAVLGDASKVKFVTVTDKSRFDAVLTNQVDVVFAHTTIKPARESSIAIDFLPVNFYDGTGVMVKTESGETSQPCRFSIHQRIAAR